MNRKAIIALAIAATLGTGAVASAAAYSEVKNDGEAREIETVLSAKTSLGQAIAAVETKGRGHAIAAGAEDEDGKVYYEVTTTDGRQRFEWRVDTASGAVQSVADEDHEDDSGEGIDLSSRSSVSLLTAIGIAEKQAHGKVLEAEYEYEDGKTVIEVEVARPRGGVKEVVIDASNGNVLADNS